MIDCRALPEQFEPEKRRNARLLQSAQELDPTFTVFGAEFTINSCIMASDVVSFFSSQFVNKAPKDKKATVKQIARTFIFFK
ncbi:hypothetical protein DLM75_22320 [Leptospira stimsonii]|uniref:Uncharacterized protein n=1 Tax=Leptospira stimsonii TaxID=2202203 RepID=A0A396YNP4_9LEPT|nr:hypothetical protein DLM75_22320 [Leptospira stimsonii]